MDLIDCDPSYTVKLPPDAEYIIGHNVDFDWKALGQPNVKRICTQALARHGCPGSARGVGPRPGWIYA